MAHPLKALKVALRGFETDAPMAPEIPLDNQRPAEFVFEDVVKGLSEAESGAGARSDAA